MIPATVIGLDIGGANLKAACFGPLHNLCLSRPFALWRQPADLAGALATLLSELPQADELAVTMTGELCDCFATKRDGIQHILKAVAAIAGQRPVHVWTTERHFVDLSKAQLTPALAIAASNWLALATWAGRIVPAGGGLLLDIGSTTTDIIALQDGSPVPLARDDYGRLQSGELIYRGARRTPLCALTDPDEAVAAEFFATSLDVFLALGDLPDDLQNTDTADNRPTTRQHALARLNRMFCLDAETIDEPHLLTFAQRLREKLLSIIGEAVERQLRRLGSLQGIILAGSGEFLGQKVLSRLASLDGVPIRSVSELLGPAISTAACAHAVAVLASEGQT